MDLGLAGRHCLITGAGAGIGRGVALTLAREDAQTTLLGRDRANLVTTAELIEGAGGRKPTIVTCDLASPDGLDDAARELTALEPLHGPVQVLVNNAGGSRPYAVDEPVEGPAWDESFALNFTAPRLLAELVLPAMRRAKWGRIVTVTGSLALKQMNAASPAKAAITSWSRALSIQVAKDGVTVNCVAPGRIKSVQIMERLFPTEEIRKKEIEQNVPIGRFGEPEEIAAMIAFLCSDRAGYVTGTMIPVDGGLLRLDLK